MFEILSAAVFLWLFVKALGLMLKLTWGMAKIVAGVLIALAFPALILCFVFVGGIALLLPIVLVAAAIGVVKIVT